MVDPIRLKMAFAYFEAGKLADAKSVCEEILRDEQDNEAALKILEAIKSGADNSSNTLSDALEHSAAGRYQEAQRLLETLIATDPENAQALCALGSIHFHLDHYNQSQAYLKKALALQPDFAEAYAVLGNCRINQADIYGAMEAFERSHAISPFNKAVYSSYLFYMAFHPDYDGKRLNQENAAWGQTYEKSVTPFDHSVPGVTRPDRLRIGFLSYEFSTHVTSFYFEPLVNRHDRSRFEIYCYAGNEDTDETTKRLSGCVDVWRNISGLDPLETARRIKEDGIHILVSVSSYLAKQRLPFAYKPAPIQVCYQNRASTMGFHAVDYLITEELADPTGEAEELYLEELVRLTDRTCYSGPSEGPEPGEPPVLENGYVTFGTFNNTAKITPQAISVWADILNAVEGSRLLIKNIIYSDDDDDWNPLRKMLLANGIDLTRVDFLPYYKARKDHLAAYHKMDIMLDTFPFNGGATCCDALWMGVPVIALAGRSFCRGQAREYLTKLGLSEFITETEEDYKNAVIDLAGNAKKIGDLRQSLRPLMSKIMLNHDLHATELTVAFDHMWATYMAGKPAKAFYVSGTTVSDQIDASPANV